MWEGVENDFQFKFNKKSWIIDYKRFDDFREWDI